MASGSRSDLPDPTDGPLMEGRDFSWEKGLMVMTAAYLLRRGYCCESGCRNCPYDRSSRPNNQEPTNEFPA